MQIKIFDNKIELLNNNLSEILDIGINHIDEHGIQVVDHVVDLIITKIPHDKVVQVFGMGIPAKMISRKLEDRLKKEVQFVETPYL
jgi:hypothetical protein